MAVDTASRTAWMVAAFRGRATARKPPLCDDPWAARLAGAEGLELAVAYEKLFPYMELWTAIRGAYFDRAVRRLSNRERSQVVLLGAGLDTRAARLASPGLRFFEVDHPESQKVKLSKLGALDYPVASATYVACDFERDDFVERLAAAGFRPDEPSLFVWEGVTTYLTEQAVRGTLRRIATACAPRSIVGFDHLRRRIVTGELRDPKDLESRSFVAELGEPLRFGVDDALPLLFEVGFRKVRSTTFDEICLDFTGTYDRAHMFALQRVVLASVSADDVT
jgi:methyltransferase (TIGR00027 family)